MVSTNTSTINYLYTLQLLGSKQVMALLLRTQLKCLIFSTTILQQSTKDDGNNPPRVQRSPHLLEDVTFTPDVVFSALRSLRAIKSCGPDGIPNILLKRCAQNLTTPLCHIFEMSLRTRKLPEIWKTAYITPIHKKGPTSVASNYRPISLTCTCCRVMEKIDSKCILAHLSIHGLISPH